jgi:glycosyltransferase involved in cell wall biosynthesis
MKICMLAPEFIPAWGGVGTYIVELLRHLPKNVEAHVVAPIREGFGGEEKCSVENDFSRYFKSNVKVHFLCMASDTFYYNGRFQYECFKQVPNLLKENKIDIIHSHTAHMPDLLLMFRNLKVPIVTTVHSTIKYQRMGTRISQKSLSNMEKSERATYLAYPFLRLSEEIYYRRKRYYISPSNYMKGWLKNNFPIHNGDISVIPNSVDINDYSQNQAQPELEPFLEKLWGKRIILYVGRLIAMKGVDLLLKVIPGILKDADFEDLLFVFAGPGDKTQYESMAKSLGCQSSCLFTGQLSRSSVIQLMRRAELLVAPSFIENAPYTILESMACGLPVVASNVGGVSEIIENGYNGFLFSQNQNSSRDMENLITDFLNDKSLENSVGENAVNTVKTKFSWDVNLKKYIDVYCSTLNNFDE